MISLFNIVYCKYCLLLVLLVNLGVMIWIITVYLTFYYAIIRFTFFILMAIFNDSGKIEVSFITKYRYLFYCFLLNFDSRELLSVVTFCTVIMTYLYNYRVNVHCFKYSIQTYNDVMISDWLNYCIFLNNLIIIVFCDHTIFLYVQYPYLGYLLFVASFKDNLYVVLFLFLIMGGINIKHAKIYVCRIINKITAEKFSLDTG